MYIGLCFQILNNQKYLDIVILVYAFVEQR